MITRRTIATKATTTARALAAPIASPLLPRNSPLTIKRPLSGTLAVRVQPRATTDSRTDDFHTLLIGGGFAMFGTSEGPWNFSTRLEHRLGPRLKVSAVIDPTPARAQASIDAKRASFVHDAYAETVVLPSVSEFRRRVDAGLAEVPRAILVASPPYFRGGLQPTNNLETQLHELFPTSAILLEKPVATGIPPERSVEEAKAVGEMLRGHRAPVSVGYVLRYLAAVREMKKIIRENSLTVMATNARYVTAYELAVKSDWWNKDIMQGPIIEQGTHICDLSRYFAGEVDMDTIHANALEAYEKPGQLSKLGFDEASIVPSHLRIPRATSASWKYESGAVGTMLHATALHGKDYAIELEVYADGFQLILSDPFGTPALHIRQPGSDAITIHPTPGDDPYQTEMDAFIDSIEGVDSGAGDILSTFEDAARTYEMTWRIRLASEETSRKVGVRRGAGGAAVVGAGAGAA
ncbi:hypothetical protein IAT38_007192 [Cryptococcus sp. DSM 104549]